MVNIDASSEGPARADPAALAADQEGLFRQLDEAVGTQGIEALAWYHPFHLSEDEWGIYVPTTSIHYGALRWFDRRIKPERRVSLAFQTLLAHEVIHHACEYAVAQLELLLDQPCWVPARRRLRKANLQWLDDEEALANAHSLRDLRRLAPRLKLDGLNQAYLASPRGYRDFAEALTDEGFEDHRLEVLRHNCGFQAVNSGIELLNDAFDADAFYPDIEAALASCPLYLIDDLDGIGLPPLVARLISCIPRVTETNRFQRMFKKIDGRLQKEWLDAKIGLAQSVPRHPKFKKLNGPLKDYFGLYLSNGYRVHLRPTHHGEWEAVEIGPHKLLGHG